MGLPVNSDHPLFGRLVSKHEQGMTELADWLDALSEEQLREIEKITRRLSGRAGWRGTIGRLAHEMLIELYLRLWERRREQPD